MKSRSLLLHENTLRLRNLYRDLDSVAGELLRNPDQTVGGMDQVRDKMDEIRATEAVLRPIRAEHLEEHGKMPADLQAPTDETIGLLESLMSKITELEGRAQEQSHKLRPKIQEGVRAVQMQNAYESNSR